MNSSSIEVHNWVTMGSPLKHDTQKPVENTGNWFNYYSKKDPVTHYEIYPPFPSFGEMYLAFAMDCYGGPGLSKDSNIPLGNQRPVDMHHVSFLEHIAYWGDDTVLTDLRKDLQ
jgi:hypothetical protein